MSQPPPLPPFQPPGVSPLNYQGYRPCPGCGMGPLEEPKFTLWGGLIGHKILGVEQCRACRKWWVKKTGQPGGTRVVIYLVGGIVLGLIVAVLVIIGGMR
jgi:hypothetical protein